MISKWIYLTIIIIALVLVSIWFKDGNILGYAEAALPFYNISRYYDQTAFAWTEHPGLGSFASITTAGKPTYWLLSFIQQKGIPGYIIQAGVFWFFLVSSGIGIALLIKYFFKEIPQKYVLLGVFFFWFNPIFLVNIWNRFLLNYIFFFALMPLASFIFLKGLQSKNIVYSLIINLILVSYSYAYSSYSFLILIWLIFTLFTCLYFLLAKDKSLRIYYVKFFFASGLLFLLANAWWISQMLSFTFSGTFKNISGTLFNTNTNYDILKSLSERLGNLTDVLRFINISFYIPTSSPWVASYNFPVVILAHFILVGGIMYACFSHITKRSILILTSLFFLSICFTKGINPPLGEVYGFLFQHLKFLQAFRNPFEKFSLLIPLFTTPLFCFSLYYYSTTFPRLKRFIEVFTIAILIFWSYPYFSGRIFTNTTITTDGRSPDYQVEVPTYYQNASDWLESQGGNFRFLELPLADEGITYLWTKGYSGADMPSTLFSTPGIIFNTSVPYYSKLVPEIDKIFYETEDFSPIANLVNIRFYLTRSDIDWKARSLKNPQEALNKLQQMEKNGQVSNVANFGKLSIWQNLNHRDTTFYGADTILNTVSSQEASDIRLLSINDNQVIVDGTPDFLKNGILEKTYPRYTLYSFKGNASQALEITYKKVSPAKYIVHVKNSHNPFMFIFSELFDPNWQARYNDQTILENHYLVNAYANGWWVDRDGSFEIEVEFAPQKLLDLGEIISTITFSGMILLLSGWIIIKKWKK